MRPACKAAGLVAALLPLLAAAAPMPERWDVGSQTAESITGNVTFTPDHLRFHGQDFAIAFVRIVPGLNADSPTEKVALYRVLKPQDPIVKGGNRVCGGKTPSPVTYFGVDHSVDSVSLSAYSGTAEPSVKKNALCAIFNYTRK